MSSIEVDGKRYWQGFHARDGWYFRRIDAGAVEVFVTETARYDAPILRRVVLDEATWASIVASVCARGETGATWATAREFHQEEG